MPMKDSWTLEQMIDFERNLDLEAMTDEEYELFEKQHEARVQALTVSETVRYMAYVEQRVAAAVAQARALDTADFGPVLALAGEAEPGEVVLGRELGKRHVVAGKVAA